MAVMVVSHQIADGQFVITFDTLTRGLVGHFNSCEHGQVGSQVISATPLELCWKILRPRGYAPLPTVLLDTDESLALLGRHFLEQWSHSDFPRFVHCLGAHAAGEVSPSVASAGGHLRKAQDLPASGWRGPIQ